MLEFRSHITRKIKRCDTCGYGWRRHDRNIGCGAPVDDDALLGGKGQNPVWAERKYSSAGLISVLSGSGILGDGMDCENMRPDDGANCKLWRLPRNEAPQASPRS